MQTSFSLQQLTDPAIAEAESVLRRCVHCGFCTATCPTFVLGGDERDSPRGRIVMIKEMLEVGGIPGETVTRHVDRCLSCLSCMTTCPSAVDYRRLVDIARQRIHDGGSRPLADRLTHAVLSQVLPYRNRFRVAMTLGALAKPFAKALPKRFRPLLDAVPSHLAEPLQPGVYAAHGVRKMRVGLHLGCVASTTAPAIDHASVRLLTRLGAEVVALAGQSCCGGLDLHSGNAVAARAHATATVARWDAQNIDALVVSASGCGSVIKDYGHVLGDDPAALRLAGLTKDISQVIDSLGISAVAQGVTVAWQSPCSLTHGQKLAGLPKKLLQNAGFTVVEPIEPHLCCGSAGTYALLHGETGEALRDRKASNLNALGAAVIATANIGCHNHLTPALTAPIVHMVELLDWATGGPKPFS